jgi:biopolymer transport protein ExbB/TolQ
MMNQSALLRPDWTPATVALMVLGFVVFWPLGLAMLAYILFGEKFQSFKREANQKADSAFAWCRSNSYTAPASTGNVAFDDWRKTELERLDAERRRLDEMRAEFDNYARELRRAKDQEEFDRFMRDRQQMKTSGESAPTQGFTGN